MLNFSTRRRICQPEVLVETEIPQFPMRRHSSIDLPANPGLIKPSGFQAKLLLLKDNFPDNFSIRRFSPLNSKLCFVELGKRFWQRFKSKTNWGRVTSKIRFSLPFQNFLLSSQIWTRLLKLISTYPSPCINNLILRKNLQWKLVRFPDCGTRMYIIIMIMIMINKK